MLELEYLLEEQMLQATSPPTREIPAGTTLQHALETAREEYDGAAAVHTMLEGSLMQVQAMIAAMEETP